MADELSLLKEKAALMGVTHSPNIGLDALKRKLEAVEAGEEDTVEAPLTGGKVESKQEMTMRVRSEQMRDETKLIRCRIANMNPNKAELKGEIITVGNRFVGAIRKFIPFGEAGEAYHLPKIIVDDLKAREFNQVRTRKGPNNQAIIEQKMVREYNIEILEPLTEKELQELARMQAAAAGQ